MNGKESATLEKTIQEISGRLKAGAEAMARRIEDAARSTGIVQAGTKIPDPPLVDPIRFKRLLILALKLLVVIELFSAFLEGARSGQWFRFGTDLILAGLLYFLWDRITVLLRERKESSRRKIESGGESVRLWDALIFSLLWSDEIHSEIPPDRKRLVVLSYTMITLGVVAAFLQVGSGLMPLVITGVLVLGAVNLLVWVVSAERGERESLQTELRLAREVQSSLMPAAQPGVPGFDIAGFASPAREVGGDLYGYAWLEEKESLFGVSVFDVSGKGMQAAMAAVFTSGAFASETRVTSLPGEILTRLNRAVYAHSRRGHFVAFLLAALDVRTKTLSFANAGQTKPLLRSGGRVEWVDSVGVHFPLGMKEDTVFQERTIPLASGDVLALLTDGFTDAMNDRREMFGAERLQRILESSDIDGMPASVVLERCVAAVQEHASGAPQHDDMTMVVIRVV